MRQLLEETIQYIYMDEDNQCIAFINFHGNEFFVYEAVGECCSSSWIESINNVENLIDEEIIGIERKGEAIRSKNEEKSQDEDESREVAFGYTLKTIKGYIDIEFRNESNGYYGGEVKFKPDAKLEIPLMKKNLSDMRFNVLFKEDTFHSEAFTLQNKLPIKLILKAGCEPIILKPYRKKD
jgi:hypothetical protein